MGNAWSKHVGEWYEANKGKDGINKLSDAMRSAKCKADFRANNGSPANGPSMKTEKKKNEKKAKKGTRKMRGGSTLGSPANFSADSANPTDPVASEPKMNTPLAPVMKGGKSKRYSLKELMKFIEKNVGMVKGGSKGKMIKGGGDKKIEFKVGTLGVLGLHGEFKPNEWLKHIKEGIADPSKITHGMLEHIEGAKKDGETGWDDYGDNEKELLRKFDEYDNLVSSDPSKKKEALEQLAKDVEQYITNTASTVPSPSGVAINTIVAFEKAGNEYKNVMHITPASDATKFESVKKAIEGVTSTSP